jgi:molecular chaperone HtpG
MTDQSLKFQTEVGKLLDIVAHSLYSNKEIFLRELISNASDACDKLRYASLTQADLLADGAEFRILLTADKENRTLAISDNGIGMNREDLVANLGTIARSGTAEFMNRLSGDSKKDVALIGQFGVGFYSAFMVAGEVEVLSRKAGESDGWRWVSDGQGEFKVGPAEVAARGTTIRLKLRDGEDEFLDPIRLGHIVKTYSDHIAVPVLLLQDGKEGALNSASALWSRAKSEITPEQYKEFYHHAGHAFDEPWLTIHYRAEGAIEYTGLLFVPSSRPFDFFQPDRKPHVKLYVKRVFITDSCDELMPGWLRFIKGVVDSADLPLNISREMLQHNPLLAKIRAGLTKRILAELHKKAEEAPEEYLNFWSNFGPAIKEGLYEEPERKAELLDLVRFTTLNHAQPVSLAQYVAEMKEGQQAIFTLTGDSVEALRKSPQIEGFKARGVDVLLLTDPIDEFWGRSVREYKEKKFTPVDEAGEALDAIPKSGGEETVKPDPSALPGIDALVALMRKVLEGEVKDVRRSERLTESAVCLAADKGEMSLHMERMLRRHNQAAMSLPRILEINPGHPLILKLAARSAEADAEAKLADACRLLLDQARLVEGDPLPDPTAFARRLSSLMLSL